VPLGFQSRGSIGRRRFALLLAAAVPGTSIRAADAGPAFIEIVGIVVKVSPKAVDVMSGGQRFTLIADAGTESWKGRTDHDFSQLEAGDSINARCRKDESGKLLTITLWANRVEFLGTVNSVSGNKVEVLTDPSAHPETTYQEMKLVDLGFDTVFQSGTKKDLRKGRSVQVTGVDLKNGSVHATLLVLR
jgi:hypothetical protein